MVDLNFDCPIRKDTQRITELSGDVVQAMRKLRRDLKKCDTCDQVEDCPVLKEFNEIINQAVQEVVDEWGLTL